MPPIHFRHLHIAYGQIVMRSARAFEGFAAAKHHVNLVTLVLKNVGNQARDGRLIFDNQQVSTCAIFFLESRFAAD